MKVLLTGARGQLGQDFQRLFAQKGIGCVATDLAELDITCLPAVREISRAETPSVIINCSAYNAVDRAETDFDQACLVNALGPKNLAIAAEEIGAACLHFSTDYVFDGEKGAPYQVTDEPRPVNRYGESKLLGERWVTQTAQRCFVVRLSWVFGQGNDNFVKKILKWSQTKQELKVVTDQVSRPAYTTDVAACSWELVLTGAYGLYHLANTGSCSRHEWAVTILRKAGRSTAVLPATEKDFPTPARRPKYSVLDLFPLSQVIDREPPHWQEATERFLIEEGILK